MHTPHMKMEALKSMHQQILDAGEPFVQDWPLVRDPLPCLYLTAAYLLIVTWIGPMMMKHRKPFQLKIPIMFHNLLLILLNAVIFCMGGWLGWFYYENYTTCFLFGHKDKLWEALPTYAYYISKYIDWIDTLFLVLRKKNSHMTFLHVYHHATMPIATWLFFKLAPGGHTTYGGFMNTLVHVIMYSYFFLSSLGPHMQPYLKWKKYLTQLQLFQFATGFLQAAQWLFKPCGHPMILTYILCTNSLVLFALFTNFYLQTYNRSRAEKKRS